MSTSLTFRAATPPDLAVIANLIEQLSRHEGKNYPLDIRALGHALFGPQPRVPLQALLAEEDGAVVASVLYYPGYDVMTTCHGYHLSDLVVAEGYRRRGIGRLLLAALAAQNLAEGGQWISLTALTNNSDAYRFYASLGFTQVPVGFFAIGRARLEALTHNLPK